MSIKHRSVDALEKKKGSMSAVEKNIIQCAKHFLKLPNKYDIVIFNYF